MRIAVPLLLAAVCAAAGCTNLGPRALEAWSAAGESPAERAVARTLEELDKRQQEVAERDTLADLLRRCAST